MVKFCCILVLAILSAWGSGSSTDKNAEAVPTRVSQHTQTEEPMKVPLCEVNMTDLLTKYVEEEFSYGSLRRNVMWRDAFRVLFPVVVAATALVLLNVYIDGIASTKKYPKTSPCDNLTDYIIGNSGVYDFTSLSKSNLTVGNTTVNSTLEVCSFQILSESRNLVSVSYYAMNAASSLLTLLALWVGAPFQRASFEEMVADAYAKRSTKLTSEEAAGNFLIFARGKYESYFNASGPFNNAGFESDLVGWRP